MILSVSCYVSRVGTRLCKSWIWRRDKEDAAVSYIRL